MTLSKKQRDILISIGVALSGLLLIWSFIWGVGVIAKNFGAALNPSLRDEGVVHFNLNDAENLNLRGLKNQ